MRTVLAKIKFSGRHEKLEAGLLDLVKRRANGQCPNRVVYWYDDLEEYLYAFGDDPTNVSIMRDFGALFLNFEPAFASNDKSMIADKDVNGVLLEPQVGDVWIITFANVPILRVTVKFI